MESYIIESNKQKSRLPARLDFLQSGTGLVLGLFVWAHIVLDASIILGPKAFNWVSKNMELAFLSDTGHGYPIAVFFAVFVVFTLFIIHALLGMRKFPISWKQHRIMKDQMTMITHQDTNLWYIQALTGFIMFFAGSVHLYTMLTHPDSIDPYLCASRVVADNMWLAYLILLVCVVLHGNIGLYRLCMKWGWFQGADYQRGRKNRAKLKNLRNKLIIGFLSVGLLALLVFAIIGLRHKDGGPDQSTHAAQTHEAAEPAVVEKVPEEASETEAVHEQAVPEANPVNEEAATPIEETVTHNSAPVVQESEPAHEEAAGDQETVQKEAPGHMEEAPAEAAVHDRTVPEANPVHEEAAPPIEETVTHGSAPVGHESEPAHEEAVGDQETVQKETPGHDEAAHEETHEEAGSSDPEEHAAQGDALHIEGGHGPQETL